MPSICVCVCVGIVNTMQVHTVTRNSLSSQVRWSARARAREPSTRTNIYPAVLHETASDTQILRKHIHMFTMCSHAHDPPPLPLGSPRPCDCVRYVLACGGWQRRRCAVCSGREIENPDATGKSHSPHISPVLGIICVQSNYNLCVCVCVQRPSLAGDWDERGRGGT